MKEPSPLIYLAAFGAALAGALAITPLMRRFASRVQLADGPSERKAQPEPIALLGGVAIYAAAAAAVLAAFPSEVKSTQMKGIFLAGLVILVSGLQDDISGMDPWLKLISQATAGLVLVGFGMRANLTSIGLVNIAVTVLWVVAVVNAVNLADNMDGLATGLALAACASYFVIAVIWDQYLVATLAAVLAGGCLGFLVYNFPPAKIYMGDAGSHFLGFLLAVMGLTLRFPSRPHWVSVLVPLFVLAVFFFDATMVTVSRLRRGVPVSLGGTDHTSHRLVVAGLTRRQVVLAMMGAGVACGLAALVVVRLAPLPAYAVAAVFGGLVGLAVWWLERIGAPGELVYEKASGSGSGGGAEGQGDTVDGAEGHCAGGGGKDAGAASR